jgi:hypothetical protein
MRVVDLLEECAATLQPFTETFDVGTSKWNGSAYVPTLTSQQGDMYALAWFSSLKTAAALLHDQNCFSKAQIAVLRNEFLGGMGSFQDFSLSTEHWGAKAHDANQRLERLRAKLFECLADVEKNA